MNCQTTGHLLDGTPPPPTGEHFEDIGNIAGVRIERIISSDAPDSGWQVQAWDEWVMLVEGRAELEIIAPDGKSEAVALGRGAWLFIAAGQRHRVAATAAGTVWLALHAPSSGS